MNAMINWKAAVQNVGNASRLPAVVAAAIDECVQAISHGDQYVTDGNDRSLRRLAHSLGGVTRVFECTVLEEVANLVEVEAEHQRMDLCRTIWPALRTILEITLVELRDFQEHHKQ